VKRCATLDLLRCYEDITGLFLIEDRHASKSENTSEALRIELIGDLRGHSKEELWQILD
jgi:hypothetical protein